MSNALSHKVMNVEGGVPVRAWVHGVEMEAEAEAQLRRVAAMPFVHKHVAVMPDVHAGRGATVGSVIATRGAIIPAAVGVDIGCGMIAVRTSLTASQLPDSLKSLRSAIERAVPHGRTDNGGAGDRGAWRHVPEVVSSAWATLRDDFAAVVADAPRVGRGVTAEHLGTLGSGNHFIELCLDEAQAVWVMLHSGSRGVGNRIGSHYIALAREEMRRWFINLPDQDLAYLPEGSAHFEAYLRALSWAQRFAATNREVMLRQALDALRRTGLLPDFEATLEAVNCHHNYVAVERHYGERVYVTRKGAVRAGAGELGIIPGSMGARSYIVRGKGSEQSFCSCSHGAGRRMSRTAARAAFTVEDHARATEGVECRKDADVIDETPLAYKDIDAVMAAQGDLVEVAHTLKQVLCVKG